MCFGVIQCFSILFLLDIDWPTFFLEISIYISLFSFNFNFFKPECSAKMDYYKIWTVFLQ